MKGKLIRPALVAVAIVAVLLVVGGIAYATVPDSNGAIHACYHVNGQGSVDASGTLRVIDPSSTNKDGSACKHDEKALDFSQTGPTGAQGSQGPQGPQGPSGSSHAYSTSNEAGQTLISPNAHTITQLTLPAGNYVLSATGSVVKTGIFNTTGSDNDVKCFLDDPDDNTIAASEAEASYGDYEDAVPYVLVGTVSLPTGGTMSVECTTLTGTVSSEVDFNSLVATKVDAVN
jgi:hypothetical protein